MPHICRMVYLLAALIGAALLVSVVWKPAPPQHFAGLAGADVPRSVGGWVSGADESVPADVQAALSSASLTSRTYQPVGNGAAGNEAPVNFVLIGGTDRSALHDPRSCLIGAGMQIQDDHLESLPGTGVEARACHAVTGTAAVTGTSIGSTSTGSGFDIIYLYLVNGRIINSATQIRAAMLWSALLGRRGTPVYFLRFTRPLYSDPRQDALGHAAMLQFATAMWTRLQPRLLPPTRMGKGHECVKQNLCRERRIS